MNSPDEAITWKFTFGLEREDGKPVGREAADELIDLIIKFVETRGMLIGGGYCSDD